MCGRLFTEQDITLKAERLQLPFIEMEAWNSLENKNDVPPGVKILVAYKDRIQPTLWGWWFWQKNKLGKQVKRLVINTRNDTLVKKLQMGDSKYQEAMRTKRVLVLTNGFYEWPEKKQTLFKVPSKKLFALAGLVFQSKNADGSTVEAVSIITVPPNDDFSKYHDRMPLIIPEDRYTEWLNTPDMSLEQLQSFLNVDVAYEPCESSAA